MRSGKILDFLVIAIALFFVCMLVYAGVSEIRDEPNRAAKAKIRQQQIIANYKSPVEHTDAQRLDWLTANPTKAPWIEFGTDPRHEIDYALDQETSK